MSMKLTYRDKVIIIVLAVLIVLGVGIFSFIKPKFTELQSSEDRLAAKEAEQAEVQSKMDTLDALKTRLEDDIEAVEDTQKKFLSEKDYGETYQLSEYLRGKLSASGIEITGISLDRIASTSLEAYTVQKYAAAYNMKINADIAGKLPEEVYYAYNGSYPAAPESVAVGGTVATVTYKTSDYSKVFDAVQAIADNEENLYLQTVSADYTAEAGEDGNFTGDLVIEVYEINPLDRADIED